ncbi:selenoprotein S isoform X1 [Tachyglossus aculeatus]|uniref:selenoprotein S isoform X1 n=1 Tax=Tachyglossus aculeatus TaxID=9261 RepID=UPI0018F78CAF|nr:selenoprotein S isoform X1 [Tachyglossus aculeatus]
MAAAEMAAQQLDAKPPLEAEGLHFLQHTVGSVLSAYGWYILFGCVVLYLIFQKLSGSLRVMRQRYSDTTGAAIDPEVVVKRQEALAASRLRMQEELNAQAEKYREKQKQLEEAKRRQKIEIWESMQEGKSYKGNSRLRPKQETDPGPSTSSVIPKPKPARKPLRGGSYNPLSGEGGGTCSWRPGRRGPSSGG